VRAYSTDALGVFSYLAEKYKSTQVARTMLNGFNGAGYFAFAGGLYVHTTKWVAGDSLETNTVQSTFYPYNEMIVAQEEIFSASTEDTRQLSGVPFTTHDPGLGQDNATVDQYAVCANTAYVVSSVLGTNRIKSWRRSGLGNGVITVRDSLNLAWTPIDVECNDEHIWIGVAGVGIAVASIDTGGAMALTDSLWDATIAPPAN
jgi:hypothetical protein